jgi:type II secretory pathway component PulF
MYFQNNKPLHCPKELLTISVHFTFYFILFIIIIFLLILSYLMRNEKKQTTRFNYWTVRFGMIETIVCLINSVSFDMHVGRLLETWKWTLEYRQKCITAGEAD